MRFLQADEQASENSSQGGPEGPGRGVGAPDGAPEGGLLLIDAEGQVGALDPKRIANPNRALHLSQRFGRMWHVSDGLLDRLGLEEDLRRGLERDEFEVYLQPQAEVASNEVVGAEALVRWNHPQRGVVLPEAFISVAEQSDLILRIGEHVLRAACLEAARRQRAGARVIRVAVNLSAAQFHDGGLARLVGDALDDAGLEPSLLELEITESTAMRHTALAAEIMRELAGMQVKLSLDDFGTGFSSLQYLKDLPIDALKIDRSFVSGLGSRAKDEAIVAAVIAIGQSLGMKVIAEGIETAGQLRFLRERGCEWYQGYLLGRPVPMRTFDLMLAREAA